MVEKKVKVNSNNGIHMRPALDIVDIADNYDSDITIVAPSGSADAKSILQLTMLGIRKGTEIIIKADGTDEQEAVDTLTEIIEKDFEKELVEE